ncbi:radical SAM protein [Planomonospora parontospora]|uniref:radical SAM protein n=1 Tax=Planomonospora parontospora TaxID=58119 RepID=UPI001670ACCB|nr:radical SAM protein [Planomonospora parontospora]GGL42337.1 hypothetical protein GCM10014719_49560 [Planomonospora parontospora subsp. antibiotica]GII18405.1 hypothetical protein Ppa05_51310 [Planomonospora parontospora subsp. antibiotica]
MAVLPGEPGEGPLDQRVRTAGRPRIVYFNLFDDCNARCNMCECWEKPRTRRTTEHYREALEHVLELSPDAIRFTGGEPLLLRDLPDLVRRVSAAGVRVSVITNGRLLGPKAMPLAEAGCAEIVVSLDAFGLVHDQIRRTHGLFERCVAGIDSVVRSGMSYGVNTVVQRLGADDLPRLANLLLDRPDRPAWWHLIPIRDNGALTPTGRQLDRLRETIPVLVGQAAVQGVEMVADPGMFDAHGPVPCDVPSFTAYVRAETGEIYGCNMLAYADGVVGSLHDVPPDGHWPSPRADELRTRCAAGTNTACSRCDPASRAMNHLLRRLADETIQEGAYR